MSTDAAPGIAAALAALRAIHINWEERYGTMPLMQQANQGLVLAAAVEAELPRLLAAEAVVVAYKAREAAWRGNAPSASNWEASGALADALVAYDELEQKGAGDGSTG